MMSRREAVKLAQDFDVSRANCDQPKCVRRRCDGFTHHSVDGTRWSTPTNKKGETKGQQQKGRQQQ